MRSPFVGLAPFEAIDADYFRGRDTETEIISANLQARRLTLVYGPSGVGKTSILNAGVICGLERTAASDSKRFGRSEYAVVVLRTWKEDPWQRLVAAAAAVFGCVPPAEEEGCQLNALARQAIPTSWSSATSSKSIFCITKDPKRKSRSDLNWPAQ